MAVLRSLWSKLRWMSVALEPNKYNYGTQDVLTDEGLCHGYDLAATGEQNDWTDSDQHRPLQADPIKGWRSKRKEVAEIDQTNRGPTYVRQLVYSIPVRSFVYII